jgi:hypothetical protein
MGLGTAIPGPSLKRRRGDNMYYIKTIPDWRLRLVLAATRESGWGWRAFQRHLWGIEIPPPRRCEA